MKLVYRYRVKNSGGLAAKARAISYVWNFCNDTQKTAIRRGRKWPSYFDFTALVAGSSKELGIPSNSIEQACKVYEKSRRQHKRPWLRWRGKKSLGWVPFRGVDTRFTADGFKYAGKVYRLFGDRRPVGKILDGSSFSQDAKGNWYLNVCVEVAELPQRQEVKPVGIDLGLKDFASLSNGA